MIARITDDLYPSAARARERATTEGTGPVPDPAEIAREASAGAVVLCARSGYFQHIDHGALVSAAKREGAKIILRFRPGQFVLHGEPLAAVCPKDRGPQLEAVIDRSVSIGRHRTLTQDSEFAIAQIIEIAIRALSPAVNDSYTGVACVDWLADALLILAEKPPLEGNWYDLGGELRVWMPDVRLERLVKLAFDQIRQASTQTPAVLIRQLDVIRRLAPRLPAPARTALADQANAIREIASGSLVAMDRRDLEAAWNRATAALDGAAGAR
jgi:uncharacterized membrane protein